MITGPEPTRVSQPPKVSVNFHTKSNLVPQYAAVGDITVKSTHLPGQMVGFSGQIVNAQQVVSLGVRVIDTEAVVQIQEPLASSNTARAQ